MLRASIALFAAALATMSGCAKPTPVSVATTTAAPVPRPGVNVSPEIIAKCNIKFGDIEGAPMFDYDEAALLPLDRKVLQQVATCMTTGALKMYRLALLGRADPRGEEEYNMVLGTHRADVVRDYLLHLGVAPKHLIYTSRGALDAEGKDEDGWQRDRRVDLLLIY